MFTLLPLNGFSILTSRGHICGKLLLDITVYLEGPTQDEFLTLLHCYQQICPEDSRLFYLITETPRWQSVLRPSVLTNSARVALANGSINPFIAPVLKRIGEERAFDFRLWDRRNIDDPLGSWSFTCGGIHLRNQGVFSFVRFVFPLHINPQLLRKVASEIADRVRFRSGHGGFSFCHSTLSISSSFDVIHQVAKRYWGIEIEQLASTIPLLGSSIKSVNWMTMLGGQIANNAAIHQSLASLKALPGIEVDTKEFGIVLLAGPEPSLGDQNRQDSSLQLYSAVARELRSLFLCDHPTFPGEKFGTEHQTIGWIRRFVEPEGWR